MTDGAGSRQVQRRRVSVLDVEMSYLEAGAGDPIVFLHGNPTSSYLWRNILPALTAHHRCLAPDLVGMGRSGAPPLFTYRLVDHARYLDAWFDAVAVGDNATLVIHDWGSVLGFYRARRFPHQVKAIAYMEAIIAERSWPEFGRFEQAFRAIRSPEGEQMVLEQNFFVESVLPSAILRQLTAEEMQAYRTPFPTPLSRLPTLVWPRQIPVEGQPRETAEIIAQNSAWMATSPIPKLFINADPGNMLPRVRALCKTWPNQREVTVPGLHYIQEDSPQEISAALVDFIRPS